MTDLLLDPWAEAVDEFPLLATDDDKLRALVHYAVLAPSGHNTQPWKFRVHDGVLELRADRSRALPVCDPADRELVISLGAALFHLRVAARRFGRHLLVETLPDPDDRDLVARCRLGAEEPPTTEERRLFAAIPRRRTSRFPFDDRVVTLPVSEDLRRAVVAEGAWVCQVEDEVKASLADLVAEGDRRLLGDARFRHELARWVHPNHSSHRDGVPGYAQGVGDVASLFGPFVVRNFDLGKGQSARDHELALAAPLLLVIGSSADEPSDWLTTGQALARLLLTAHDEELHASFLNQPVELDDLRERLRALLGRPGVPQLVLRLGYGRDPRATPRRPVSDVLEG
jgi:nitroreductase